MKKKEIQRACEQHQNKIDELVGAGGLIIISLEANSFKNRESELIAVHVKWLIKALKKTSEFLCLFTECDPRPDEFFVDKLSDYHKQIDSLHTLTSELGEVADYLIESDIEVLSMVAHTAYLMNTRLSEMHGDVRCFSKSVELVEAA